MKIFENSAFPEQTRFEAPSAVAEVGADVGAGVDAEVDAGVQRVQPTKGAIEDALANIALPEGIIRTPEPFDAHDFTVLDPHNLQAVDELTDRIRVAAREAMDPAGVMYNIWGEGHDMPAHIMAQCAGAARMRARFNDSADRRYRNILTYERPFNDLAVILEENYKLKVSFDQYYQYYHLHEHDADGRLYLESMLALPLFPLPEAEESRKRVFNLCYEGNIPFIPVDAADKVWGDYIDGGDALACEVAADLFDGLDLRERTLPCTDDTPENDIRGMVVRNFVMAARMVAAGITHKAGIVDMATGLAHMGNIEDGMEFETSLPYALVTDKDFKTSDHALSFFVACENYDVTPEAIAPPGGHEALSRIYIRGLSDDCFHKFVKEVEVDFIERLSQSYSKGNSLTQFFQNQTIPSYFKAPPARDYMAAREKLEQFLVALPSPERG